MKRLAKHFVMGFLLFCSEAEVVSAQSQYYLSEDEKFLVVEAKKPATHGTSFFYIPTHRTIIEARGGAYELRRARRLSGQPEGQVGVCLKAIHRLVDFQLLLGKQNVRELENWNYSDLESWKADILEERGNSTQAVQAECKEILSSPDMVISIIIDP